MDKRSQQRIRESVVICGCDKLEARLKAKIPQGKLFLKLKKLQFTYYSQISIKVLAFSLISLL